MMHPWYGERCPRVPTAPTPSTLQLQRGKQVQSDTTVLPAATWDGACSRKHTQPQHSKPGEQQPTPPVREKQAIESKRHRESYRKVNKRLRWKKKKKPGCAEITRELHITDRTLCGGKTNNDRSGTAHRLGHHDSAACRGRQETAAQPRLLLMGWRDLAPSTALRARIPHTGGQQDPPAPRRALEVQNIFS